MNHHHAHMHPQDHAPVKNIKIAFFLNLFFTLIEFAGGVLTNSLAILSDALHDLGDSLSLGLAWYFEDYSKKEKSKSHTYGYRRYTILGAFINAVILCSGSIIILWQAIPRLWNPQTPDAQGMILIAILGVLVNGAAVLRLKRGKSLNQRVVYLHLLEDVLGWIAVLIGAILMLIFDLPIIDPILSVLISLFILFNVYRSSRKILQIMMQGTPSPDFMEKITNYFQNLIAIKSFHDLHIWSMDGEYHVLTVHLIVSDNLNLNEIHIFKTQIRDKLHELGIEHATLEFELTDEDCGLEDC